MSYRLKQILVQMLLLTFGCLGVAQADDGAAARFKQLAALVGDWQGSVVDGRSHRVSYRLTAGDSVLVETWTLGSGRESMTLYHLDGDTLLADHYCVQGNVPRLQLVKDTNVDKMSFAFRDGSNLQVKGKSHQQAFWIRLDDADAFERGESYVENGDASVDAAKVEAGSAVRYTRIANHGSAP